MRFVTGAASYCCLLPRRGSKRLLLSWLILGIIWVCGIMILPRLLPSSDRIKGLHRRIHQETDAALEKVHVSLGNSALSIGVSNGLGTPKIWEPKKIYTDESQNYGKVGESFNNYDFTRINNKHKKIASPSVEAELKASLNEIGRQEFDKSLSPPRGNVLPSLGELHSSNSGPQKHEGQNQTTDLFKGKNSSGMKDFIGAKDEQHKLEDEGPYTLPILRTPKAGSKPKRSAGYLAKLHGERQDLPDDGGEDVGEGIVVPFNGHGGAFRGSGGVFPIHPKQIIEAEVSKTEAKMEEARERALVMALAAQEHGQKITDQQKTMIETLGTKKRAELQKRTKELQLRREKQYFSQLKGKGQLIDLPGGGQKIVSTSRMTIRFPASLKKLQPDDWPADYQVFLNVTHQPWEYSPDCKQHLTSFAAPHSHLTRAIASFPSSGNTWIRYLIEGSTGIYTGSLYDDTSLIKKGMYGEAVPFDSGMTIVQKTHGYTTGDSMLESHPNRLEHNHFNEVGCRGVVIIRNPFKALISHRHLDYGGHTGYAPRSHFEGKGWAQFIDVKIRLWEEFYRDWIEQCPKQSVFVTHYETLKNELQPELRKILKFLNVPVDESRLFCTSIHSAGLFKRKPSKVIPPNVIYYPEHLKNKVYGAISRLEGAMVRQGREGLPVHLYEMYDEREAQLAARANMSLST